MVLVCVKETEEKGQREVVTVWREPSAKCLRVEWTEDNCRHGERLRGSCESVERSEDML